MSCADSQRQIKDEKSTSFVYGIIFASLMFIVIMLGIKIFYTPNVVTLTYRNEADALRQAAIHEAEAQGTVECFKRIDELKLAANQGWRKAQIELEPKFYEQTTKCLMRHGFGVTHGVDFRNKILTTVSW